MRTTDGGRDRMIPGSSPRMSLTVAPGKQRVVALKKRTFLKMLSPTSSVVGLKRGREKEDGDGPASAADWRAQLAELVGPAGQRYWSWGAGSPPGPAEEAHRSVGTQPASGSCAAQRTLKSEQAAAVLSRRWGARPP